MEKETEYLGRTALCKWLDPHFTAVLLTGEDAHTLSLPVCISALFCLKQFLCVLSHLLCCVSNNKLCTCFYLLEKCRFSVGSRARGTLFLVSTPS